jgi:hypothetical protein
MGLLQHGAATLSAAPAPATSPVTAVPVTSALLEAVRKERLVFFVSLLTRNSPFFSIEEDLFGLEESTWEATKAATCRSPHTSIAV